MQRIQEEFDRLARLTAGEAQTRRPYEAFLLGHVPRGCGRALEVGCGLGGFTRLLAGRARRVTAVDLSAEMVRLARERAADLPHVEFVAGDFLRTSLPASAFDCVVSVVTLHHLPAAAALARMRDALRPGGVLIVHDLLSSAGLLDRAFDLVRLPVSVAVRFSTEGRLRQRPEVRRAWAEHGKGERYLTAREAERLRDEQLPGGRVYRHLLWRYSLVWRKPDAK